MNRLIQLKQTTLVFLLALACFALLPQIQAVSPTPDGCYPNFTTAEGCDALHSLSTGEANTGVGWRSLFTNTSGSFNTGIGAGALVLNTVGDGNTAVGAVALLLNVPGHDNTAVGASALFNNIAASFNTAVGSGALASNDSTGNDLATNNTAVGTGALFGNTDGLSNTAVGSQTLAGNTTGGGNVAIGALALPFNATGNQNVVLGDNAGDNVMTASNVTCIGAGISGEDVSNTTWIGNVFGVMTQSGTTAPVIVSDGGQLGTVVSSERFKKDIATMEKASEVILSLRPVTFHYKTDTKGTAQFGLIAEEVAKVNPALVLPDKEGKPYSVRYDQVNAMLLNEFLKEHRKVQELEATVAKQEASAAKQQAAIVVQQKQIEALTAVVQKVSAQLELSKAAPQTVQNN